MSETVSAGVTDTWLPNEKVTDNKVSLVTKIVAVADAQVLNVILVMFKVIFVVPALNLFGEMLRDVWLLCKKR